MDVLRLLKEQGFRYVFFHPNRRIAISAEEPKLNSTGGFWVNVKSPVIQMGYAPPELGDWKNSVHELDFRDSKQEIQKSLFEVGDVVYVLSHSNNGTFGVSSKGEVVEVNTESFRIRLDTGFYESHKKSNVSFMPFSIYQAGFSQVRPEPEPKKGDWGWFWDNEDSVEDGFKYAMFERTERKRFMTAVGAYYHNFSLKNPTKKND